MTLTATHAAVPLSHRFRARVGLDAQAPALVLSPMAGYTDHPFRLLCKEQGADLVTTELLSTHAMHYGSAKTLAMMDWTDDERPVCVQIFGSEPTFMGEGAALVEKMGADLVDVNLGCSVPKVIRAGACAVVTRDLGRLREMLAAVVESVSVPVTIKCRAGWDRDHLNAPEVAQVAQETGVCAVAVHGRTSAQGFNGPADWSVIRRVKESVTIPVLGSGDLYTPEDVSRLLDETGCDGAMLARGAMGNPWIFSRTRRYMQDGVLPPDPPPARRVEALLRQTRLLVAQKGERGAIPAMRCHAASYLKDLPGAAALRGAYMRLTTLADVEALLADAIARLEAGGPAEPDASPIGDY